MVEIADIKDVFGGENWLKEQSGEVATVIAARAALRTLPIWWAWGMNEAELERDPTAALKGLHACLVLGIVSLGPSHALTSDAIAGVAYPNELMEDSQINFVDSAAGAINDATGVTAATFAPDRYHADAATVRSDAAAAVFAAESASVYLLTWVGKDYIWSEMRSDAIRLSEGAVATVAPLWSQRSNPFHTKWQDILDYESQKHRRGSDGSFWTSWYQSILDGKSMLGDAARTQEMLEKIALIDLKIWDQGEAAINPLIEGIWELYRLRVEVAALKIERDGLASHRASPEHRSHNKPPDLIGADEELARNVTIVWAALDDADAALEKDVPDKARLKSIARTLLSGLKEIAIYCGKVTNVYVMSAATAGGVVSVDILVNNGRLLQFAKDLLSYVGGP